MERSARRRGRGEKGRRTKICLFGRKKYEGISLSFDSFVSLDRKGHKERTKAYLPKFDGCDVFISTHGIEIVSFQTKFETLTQLGYVCSLFENQYFLVMSFVMIFGIIVKVSKCILKINILEVKKITYNLYINSYFKKHI